MTSNIAKSMFDAIVKKDIHQFLAIYHSTWVRQQGYRKSMQVLSEMATDVILKLIAETTSSNWDEYQEAIMLLYTVSDNAAAVRRIIKAKQVLRKIIHVLGDSLICSGVMSSEIVHNIIRNSWWVLRLCVYSSKPDAEFWMEMFDSFSFTLLMVHDVEEGYDDCKNNIDWRCQVAHVIGTLKYVHKCTNMDVSEMFKNKDVCVEELKKYLSDEFPNSKDSPHHKLSYYITEVMKLDQYIIFCSSPNCRECVNEDRIYKHCAACKLSRYCSPACQTYHWKNGHSTECLGVKKSFVESIEVTSWCGIVTILNHEYAEHSMKFSPKAAKMKLMMSLLDRKGDGTIGNVPEDLELN